MGATLSLLKVVFFKLLRDGQDNPQVVKGASTYRGRKGF